MQQEKGKLKQDGIPKLTRMLILGSAVAPLITLSGFMYNAPDIFITLPIHLGITICRQRHREPRQRLLSVLEVMGGLTDRPGARRIVRAPQFADKDFTSMSFLATCMKSRVCTEEYGYMGAAREVCAVIHGRLRKSHLCFTYRIHLSLLSPI